jgi:hypothetical protein
MADFGCSVPQPIEDLLDKVVQDGLSDSGEEQLPKICQIGSGCRPRPRCCDRMSTTAER